MGRPLAPRQGAALSGSVYLAGRGAQEIAFQNIREGVAGRNGPQRWAAEDAQAAGDREDPPPSKR